MTDSPRTPSRSRGRVPLDQRSIVATAPGVPWWGALACAVAAVLIGFIIDTAGGSELTTAFTVMYVIGCIAAVLIVRNKSLFTAIAQPPLLLAVSVPLAYWTFSAGATNGLRGMIFDMALPLVQRFPTMITTTAIVWVIGAFRVVVYFQERRRISGKPRKTSGGTRTRTARRPADAASRPRTPDDARPRSAGTQTLDRGGPGADVRPPAAPARPHPAPRGPAPAPRQAGYPRRANDRPGAARTAGVRDEPAPPLPNVRYRGD